MNTPLTLEQTRALVLRAIEEKGEDHVAPKGVGVCRYFDKGQPSCIVGHVVSYIGLGPDDVKEGRGVSSFVDDQLFSDEDGAIEWIEQVQVYQDKERPWGEAVSIADRYFEQEVVV